MAEWEAHLLEEDEEDDLEQPILRVIEEDSTKVTSTFDQRQVIHGGKKGTLYETTSWARGSFQRRPNRDSRDSARYEIWFAGLLEGHCRECELNQDNSA